MRTEIGATPSIGTAGDSYGPALAKTVNGYCKAELVRGRVASAPRKTVGDLQLVTLGRVHWHNTDRLHGHLGDSPFELQSAVFAGQTDCKPLVKIKKRESPLNPENIVERGA